MKLLGVTFVALFVLVSGAAATAASLGGARVAPSRSAIAVYLVRGERVAPVRRVVAHTSAPARASLAALLAGPTAAEARQGYTTEVPSATRLRGVSLSHGVLTVDLGRRFQAGGGSQSMLLRVAQVVHTATQFRTVDRVAFRLDGKPVAAIGGEGVLVSPPVGRSSFEAEAPGILVEQPLPGDRVSSPLRIRGTANVFEAQFSLEVATASGKLLVRRSVTAGTGDGVRGSFSLVVRLRTTAERLVVTAYDRSPTDATIARPLEEGELSGNIVFTYRAGHTGSTTVVYALTRGEAQKALQARYFKVVVVASSVRPIGARTRCSTHPAIAARYVVPPAPFVARVVAVSRQALPPSEPAGRGPSFKRLYQVTFDAVKGNAVLPSGHRYTQFAYVARANTDALWCFLEGGSGP